MEFIAMVCAPVYYAYMQVSCQNVFVFSISSAHLRLQAIGCFGSMTETKVHGNSFLLHAKKIGSFAKRFFALFPDSPPTGCIFILARFLHNA